MEFLLYLYPQSQEIYQMVARAIRVVENAPVCRKHDIYGWFSHSSRTLAICTSRIASRENTVHYINEALLHESVHLAQYCKNKALLPLGIAPSQIQLSARRKLDVEKAVKIIGPSIRQVENEAFWLEDKPNEVKYVLKKYCL
jgi:hypothetical protein